MFPAMPGTCSNTRRIMSRHPLFNSLSALALFILSLFMISGCATGKADRDQNARLSTELDAANRRIDEIYHRLSVLQFMVDSHDRVLSDRDLKLKNSGFVPLSDGSTPEAPVVEESIPQPEKVTSEKTDSATVTAQGALAVDEETTTARDAETVKKETLASTTASVEGKSTEVIYAEGLSALKAGDYPTAAAMFRAVVEGHPNHDLADNAVYWTGEIFYDQKDYREAVRIFKRLVEIYPTQGKVPDALLKIGYSYHSMGDKENAVKYLKKVVVEHPFTDPGSKAEAMLNKIEKIR